MDDELSPRSQIQLLDDGRGGDLFAVDFVYTRGCLRICPGVLDLHGVKEECINCGSDGSKMLGILHRSLRGTIPIKKLVDLSPFVSAEDGSKCSELFATSHGLFAIVEYIPQYKCLANSSASAMLAMQKILGSLR